MTPIALLLPFVPFSFLGLFSTLSGDGVRHRSIFSIFFSLAFYFGFVYAYSAVGPEWIAGSDVGEYDFYYVPQNMFGVPAFWLVAALVRKEGRRERKKGGGSLTLFRSLGCLHVHTLTRTLSRVSHFLFDVCFAAPRPLICISPLTLSSFSPGPFV
jgi:hypothetical protein